MIIKKNCYSAVAVSQRKHAYMMAPADYIYPYLVSYSNVLRTFDSSQAERFLEIGTVAIAVGWAVETQFVLRGLPLEKDAS